MVKGHLQLMICIFWIFKTTGGLIFRLKVIHLDHAICTLQIVITIEYMYSEVAMEKIT